MNWFKRMIRSLTPRTIIREVVHRPGAKYDAAAYTEENKNLWANVDSLSANAGLSPQVRRTLRNRSRYEYDNNGHYSGLTDERTNQTIGTAPRMQLSIDDIPAEVCQYVSDKWLQWSESTNFADDLYLLDLMETRDGEAFALMKNNPSLPADAPQVDLVIIEGEQVANPYGKIDAIATDGIKVDEFGDPVSFNILRRHPGDNSIDLGLKDSLGADNYPAERVIYFYRKKRAAQARGVAAMQSSLPLYSQLRRFTKAVLGAAELSASFAAFMTQEDQGFANDDEELETYPGMDTIPFVRNMVNTLPPNTDIKAFEPAQPAPSFKEFVDLLLTESGRPITAPKNISTGSSADYNYSSGRLDHLPWIGSIKIRRDRIRRHALMKVVKAWYNEGKLIAGYFPPGLPDIKEWKIKWRWDAFPSIDPVKDATAAGLRIKQGFSTYEKEIGELGEDWQQVFKQRAREQSMLKELGLMVDDNLTVTSKESDGTESTISASTTPSKGESKDSQKAVGVALANGGVQNTALNGAQVSSLIALCNNMMTDVYSAEATHAAIRGCFPAMDTKIIDEIIDSLKDHKKKTGVKPAATGDAKQ